MTEYILFLLFLNHLNDAFHSFFPVALEKEKFFVTLCPVEILNQQMALLRVIIGSWEGIRTPDQVVNSHPLCQLSYPGIDFFISDSPLFCQLKLGNEPCNEVADLGCTVTHLTCRKTFEMFPCYFHNSLLENLS